MLTPQKKTYDQPRQDIKKQRHYFANKSPSSLGYAFSSSHVWMWELDYKESWAPMNSCFWTVVLEKTLESPLDCKEIQAVNPKLNQSYIFIERTVSEAETQILWPPDVKSWLLGKDPDAGNNWRQEKEPTEDEMIGWHHWLNGHELEQAPGVVDGQGSLVYCSPWDRKESDRTERLNWTEELSHHTPTPSVDWKLLHWWGEEFQLYMKFIKLKLIQWLELNSHWTETVWKLEVTGEILLSENDLGRCGMCTAFHPRKQRQVL